MRSRMTEPDNPGSDPRSLQTRAVLDGDEWVINGHKWFTSNGHAADFYIVMCRTADPDDPGGQNEKMTQIIVPQKTKGVNIVRGVPVWGKASSHCEIIYDNVRVPKENQLGRTGTGHQAAQDRLGAGRVYHCMNSVGSMWRAFDLMIDRITTREVHGGEKLEEKQFMQGFIADSYMDIQSARLMTIHCAEKMESGADPRTDISSIKVFVPQAYHRVVDRAIQVWGAAGVRSPVEGMIRSPLTKQKSCACARIWRTPWRVRTSPACWSLALSPWCSPAPCQERSRPCARRVYKGELDAGIVTEPVELATGLSWHPIAAELLVVIALTRAVFTRRAPPSICCVCRTITRPSRRRCRARFMPSGMTLEHRRRTRRSYNR